MPPFLEAQRQLGLFALAHVPMNLDYLFVHLPMPYESIDNLQFPFLKPDGLGMSILLTSPGLLYAVRAAVAREPVVVAARGGRRSS